MKSIALLTLAFCLGFSTYNEAHAQAPQATGSTSKKKEKLAENDGPIAIDVPQKSKPRQRDVVYLGGDMRTYHYGEPGFVDHSGFMFGAWLEYIMPLSFGQLAAGGNILMGALKYEGALCDISNNCTPYESTTREIISKVKAKLHWDISENFSLFGGVGYRYLQDKGEGIGFYTRTGAWAFVPIGVAASYEMSPKNKIIAEVQYDYIIFGGLRSNLSEASSAFTDIAHKQSGYGLSYNAGYEMDNWLMSLYFESWNLNESDVVESSGFFFVEPSNKSESFGTKVGFKF